jgi:hypothetical protein
MRCLRAVMAGRRTRVRFGERFLMTGYGTCSSEGVVSRTGPAAKLGAERLLSASIQMLPRDW